MVFNLTQSIDVLARTPKVLHHLLQEINEPMELGNEGLNTWSPFDIVGHLIHGEETDWIPRIEIILEQGDNLTFTPFDRFAQFKNSQGKTMSQLLSEFNTRRHSNLDYLKSKNLTRENLELPGIHPELGPVKLKEVIAAWVVHDLGHIAQISRVMAKQYKDEIGPWTKYMRVVNM